MRSNPLVSIVTPSFNSENFIRETIESVKSQTYDQIEHIVIDGGSTDQTIGILEEYEKEYNLFWISEDDNGMYDAIEKGFDQASGEIFSWLNSDDKYLPWAVEIAVKYLTKEDVEWITGHPARWNENGTLYYTNPLRPYYRRKWLEKGWYHGDALGWVQQESMFWTADLWQKKGGFPPGIQMAGDFYLWKKFAEEEDIVQVGTVIGGFRSHDDQLTSEMEKYRRETPAVGFLPQLLGTLRADNLYSLVKNIVYASPLSKW